MSRGNIVLLGVLALAVVVWYFGRDKEQGKTAGPAPRLFPAFNREAADRIEITGGGGGTGWAFVRQGSDWSLGSAEGYPIKRDQVDRFLDAVASLRKENAVGESEDMRTTTRTDDKEGRLVRVLKGLTPMAEFRIGKNPKQGYHEFFIRKADDGTIYRTQTLLAKDRDAAIPDERFPRSASGFDWHSYTDNLSAKWTEPTVWDLGGADAQEIWIKRPEYEAKIAKQGEDKWELVEIGKEGVPADADVAQGILAVVRTLSFEDILGPYAEVAKEYGLEAPETTVLLTLRKKVEKPAPTDGEKKEGEAEEKKEEEYVTFHRSIEVGKKIQRSRFDDYSGETTSTDYYAIHVGPAADIADEAEKKRAGYVFLVRSYTADNLRKELKDLRAKEEEKEPLEEEGDGKPAEEKPAEEKPADEKPAEEKPADEKPAEGEQPKDDEKKEGCGCGEKEPEGCGG